MYVQYLSRILTTLQCFLLYSYLCYNKNGDFMKLNDIIQLNIIDYTYDALGIAKHDNKTYFVKNALLGEIVEAKITLIKKNITFCETVNIIKVSKNRVEPKCNTQCGGCQLLHMNYDEQLIFKKMLVENNVKRIAKSNAVVQNCIGSEQYNYRNKAIVPVRSINGNISLGFYKVQSNDIIELEYCHNQVDVHNQALSYIKTLLKEFNVNSVKSIFLRSSNDLKELMICFITTKHINKQLVNKLKDKFGITSILELINTSNSNSLLKGDIHELYNNNVLNDTIEEFKIMISCKSFYQVNRYQSINLYNKAIELANLTKEDTVLDAYCGIGTITMLLSKYSKYVYGIEVVKEAILNANNNKVLNNIDNIEYICGKTEDMYKIVEDKVIDVVFVDPPRKGCDTKFLDFIVKKGIKKLVYISCNPSTLARDMAYLQDNGYVSNSVIPVDMFPNTTHVECISLLELNKA